MDHYITTNTKGHVGTILLYEQEPSMGSLYEPWVSHYVWGSSITSGVVKQLQIAARPTSTHCY